MPRYRVAMSTTASLSIEVEAENETDAEEQAYQEAPAGVCAQCSGWNAKWGLDIGEFEVNEDSEFAGVVYKAVELVED